MQNLDSEQTNSFVPDLKIPIRVGLVKSNGAPAVISLWYVCKYGKIYCAVQKTAKIVSYLKKNPVCGFEIAADKLPYKGIRAEGNDNILNETGAYVLDLLIDNTWEKKSQL